jgi:hypothetical protein
VNGYAATARIEHVRPRRASSREVVAFSRAGSRDEPTDPGAEVADTAVSDSLVDRFEAFRDRMSQLTFYLFDPDGWR